MCGIFGLIVNGKRSMEQHLIRRVIEDMYRLSESRGKEAAGALFLEKSSIEVLKAPVRGSELLQLPKMRTFLEHTSRAMASQVSCLLLGHTRMVTNGGDQIHDNNQPVVRDELIAVHNGIIVNDVALWSEMSDLERRYEVDTEAYLALVQSQEHWREDFVSAAARAMRGLEGANSLAVVSTLHDSLLLATSNGSIYYVHDQESNLFMFMSEYAFLSRLVDKYSSDFAWTKELTIKQLAPGSLACINFSDTTPQVRRWDMIEQYPSISSSSQRTITDHGPLGGHSQKQTTPSIRNSVSTLKNLTQFDRTSIKHLTRCTRCILPETFPFISFDDDGVCNYCQNYKPLRLHGEAALRDKLKRLVGTSNKPRILFPLSGGRDSCYGLHLLVNKFGIKPLAYTYDWGMVTDLARRNISRMCGKLGIEHVLISADIRKKRQYIRKNVTAWLRQPHLGTVPLFMAGDKQFFYYANKLKKDADLAHVLFSMNPLERTDFKVGFCGINEFYTKKHHYDPNTFNKIRLMWFYASSFLKNPSYINASLLDSLAAYLSYYFIPKDYSSLFDYLAWHESDVVSSLINDYNWEISQDTNSTWRIGDGTASFYNYIYYKVAGFSENDTFRSNQIREGLLSRQEALRNIDVENDPRCESIAWYFDTINIDATAAIRAINAIPTLYRK